jgi:membrane protein DedA with SNARE-associated domain
MLDRLIAASPYLGLYLALVLGGVGFPIPEEIPVITAGVLAHQGAVRWWAALLVCIAGVVTGDLALYWTGRRWGDRVLEHRLVARFLDAPRRTALEASYRRYGMLIVFAARHVVGLRAAAFVTAGVVRLPFWKFAVADGVAIAYGIPLNFAIAYFFTAHLHAILTDLRRIESWIALALLLAVAGWVSVTLWRRSHRLLAGGAEAPGHRATD